MRQAIVRKPGPNLVEALTSVDLGRPDVELALAQHAHYCAALQRCGLRVQVLEADPLHPDATFVEDTAVLTRAGAMLTRPGADSRRDEVLAIAAALRAHFERIARIEPPGTLDDGDVCEAGQHWFIGISQRTNEAGAQQLARWLAKQDIASSPIDIRGMPGILHLKSALSWIGADQLVATPLVAGHPALAGYRVLQAAEEDSYAANLVRVNDHVLIAQGHPALTRAIRALGFDTLALDMSEFRKADGGLSCLSLRY